MAWQRSIFVLVQQLHYKQWNPETCTLSPALYNKVRLIESRERVRSSPEGVNKVTAVLHGCVSPAADARLSPLNVDALSLFFSALIPSPLIELSAVTPPHSRTTVTAGELSKRMDRWNDAAPSLQEGKTNRKEKKRPAKAPACNQSMFSCSHRFTLPPSLPLSLSFVHLSIFFSPLALLLFVHPKIAPPL